MWGIVSAPRAILSAGVAFSFVLTGCSGGPVIPPTVSVSGKILYKDMPVEGAEVGFASKLDNKDVKAARGVTNASGEFSLSTYIDPEHEISGATPGDFVVTVSKVPVMDHAKMMEEFQSNPAMEFKSDLPEKYSDAKTSPLNAKVEVGGTNNFPFTLED